MLSKIFNIGQSFTHTHTVYFTVGYSDSIYADIGEQFNENVLSVLNDERGWKKYGYKFVRVNDDDTMSGHTQVLRILLVSLDEVRRECNTKNLSCYVPATHRIFINADNWMGNAPISVETPPGMELDEYRNYVINHEVGHSLGLNHPNNNTSMGNSSQCDMSRAGTKGSVMMQMSKGSKFISPCKPNCWPLDPADYNEFTNGEKDVSLLRHFPFNIISVILVFVVIVIVAFIAAISTTLFSLSKSTNTLVSPKYVTTDSYIPT